MIIHRSDMEANQGLSAYERNGRSYVAQQHHDAFETMENFIKEVQPEKILEVGTAQGGLTAFMYSVAKEINPNIEFISLDIYNPAWYDILRADGINIISENVFDWTNFDITNETVKSFISDTKKKIIFCDGGDKIREFKLLSKYLNPGDFILAHDYVDTQQNFLDNYKGKIWNWHEISEDFIQDACEEYGLVDYKKEIFSKVVWACKVKL